MLRKTLMASVALAIAGGGFFISASPLTKSALFDPSGANRPPKYFSIDKDFDRAKAELQQVGFDYIGIQNSNECLLLRFSKSLPVHIFADLGWRGGIACIVERNGTVQDYSWEFKVGAP